MIKPIITDKEILFTKCSPVIINSALSNAIITDLIDTANSLYAKCAGLAANQIGYCNRVIAVKLANGFEVMINPEYLEKSGKLKNGKEGCLSRPVTIENPINIKRYYKIKIKYTNINGNTIVKKFKNFHARVIQHEIDHLYGILIGS